MILLPGIHPCGARTQIPQLDGRSANSRLPFLGLSSWPVASPLVVCPLMQRQHPSHSFDDFSSVRHLQIVGQRCTHMSSHCPCVEMSEANGFAIEMEARYIF